MIHYRPVHGLAIQATLIDSVIGEDKSGAVYSVDTNSTFIFIAQKDETVNSKSTETSALCC